MHTLNNIFTRAHMLTFGLDEVHIAFVSIILFQTRQVVLDTIGTILTAGENPVDGPPLEQMLVSELNKIGSA